MIYACDDCGFLFRRFGKVESCPVCQGARIRAATREEAEILQGMLLPGEKASKIEEEEMT